MAEQLIVDLTADGSGVQTEFDAVVQSASTLANDLKALADAFKSTNSATDGLGDALDDAGNAADDYTRDTNEAANASDKFAKEQKKVEGTSKSMGSSLKGLIGIVGSLVAAYAGFKVISELITLAGKQEESEKRLESVLKATGNAAGFSAAQMKQMAAEMQNVTVYGDELVMESQAILATFKNIRGDEFRDTMIAAADLSEVLGTDLKGSTTLLAKAMNDPITGLTKLADAGVTFTQQQKDMVAAMIEAGDVAGAQRVILEELNGQVGGASKAATETFNGQWAQVWNTVGDVGEVFGQVLIPIIQSTLPVLLQVAEWAASQVPLFQEVISTVMELGSMFVDFVTPAVLFFVDTAITGFTAFEVAIEQWDNVIKAAVAGVSLGFVKAFEIIKHGLMSVPELFVWFADNFKEVFSTLGNFASTLFTNMGKNISNFFTNTWNWLTGKKTSFKWTGLTEGFESTLKELPKIAEREKSSLEKSLEKTLNSATGPISTSFKEKLEANKKALNDFLTTNKAPDKPAEQVKADPNALAADFSVTMPPSSGGTSGGSGAGAGGSGSGGSGGAGFEDLLALNARISAAALETSEGMANALTDKSKGAEGAEAASREQQKESNTKAMFDQLITVLSEIRDNLPATGVFG